MNNYQLDYLDQLESEAIHIMREVAGQFERPALLIFGWQRFNYSGSLGAESISSR